jgi:aminoglycoside phosphotransferase (APT) family kinase protein
LEAQQTLFVELLPKTSREYLEVLVFLQRTFDKSFPDIDLSASVYNIMEPEIPIPGGRLNRGRLVRQGDFVLRPPGEDPAVEQLIIEIGKVFSGIPKTFGRDSQGRLKLEWIEGESAETFEESKAKSKIRLQSVGALLRELHDSTGAIVNANVATLRTSMDPSEVHEVVCHGDPGPGNIVFREGKAFALIDWELAAPGRRSWDLATALRYWAPLRNPVNKKTAELLLDPLQRAEWIFDGYAASNELRAETVKLLPLNQRIQGEYVIETLRSRDEAKYEAWVAKGGIRRIELDGAWLIGESQRLLQEWRLN